MSSVLGSVIERVKSELRKSKNVGGLRLSYLHYFSRYFDFTILEVFRKCECQSIFQSIIFTNLNCILLLFGNKDGNKDSAKIIFGCQRKLNPANIHLFKVNNRN